MPQARAVFEITLALSWFAMWTTYFLDIFTFPISLYLIVRNKSFRYIHNLFRKVAKDWIYLCNGGTWVDIRYMISDFSLNHEIAFTFNYYLWRVTKYNFTMCRIVQVCEDTLCFRICDCCLQCRDTKYYLYCCLFYRSATVWSLLMSFFCVEVTFIYYSTLWSILAFINKMAIPFTVATLLLICLYIMGSSFSSCASYSTTIIHLMTVILFLFFLINSSRNASTSSVSLIGSSPQ